MLKRTLLTALAAVGMLAFTASAQAAYLTLGTTNTSDAPTTLAGNTAGTEFLAKNANGSSASAYGLYGLLTATAPTVSATAVRGQNSSTNGKGYGMYGSQAGSGTGVRGFAPSGNGVWGSSASGTGVRGSSSTGYGVYGTGKFGVVGSGSDSGVWASSGNAGGSGVYGQNTTSGRGVYGKSASGQGVYGESGSQAGVVGFSNGFDGVYGSTTSANFAGTSGHGGKYGVYGLGSTTGSTWGVWGGGYVGVEGDTASHPGCGACSGVKGTGHGGYGGYFTATDTGGVGVYALGGADSYGIEGESGGGGKAVYGNGHDGFGGYFEATDTGGWGLYSEGQAKAGYFAGPVTITGGCTGCTGPSALQIDDPLDPAHKYLNHASVVSPHMKDVYDGMITTDNRGFATVKLPGYFQALNKTFRYQLTVVGKTHWDAKAAVWNEIVHNRFTIRTDQPKVKVSWQVTGVRHDRFAKAHPTRVIVPKAMADQGKYVHPELYGKPRSDGIGYRKPPQLPRATPKR